MIFVSFSFEHPTFFKTDLIFFNSSFYLDLCYWHSLIISVIWKGKKKHVVTVIIIIAIVITFIADAFVII